MAFERPIFYDLLSYSKAKTEHFGDDQALVMTDLYAFIMSQVCSKNQNICIYMHLFRNMANVSVFLNISSDT